jgi:excisionase family DNA binding protein
MSHTNRSTVAGTDRTNERWHSVDEVADHLGVARDTVYRWIEHKALPAHRLGRLWKFKLSEVDDWVRSGGAGEDDPRPQFPAQGRGPAR